MSGSELDRPMPPGGFARETEVGESDPNADSAEGLAGGMGVSSERVGPVDGAGDRGVTYAAGDTQSPEADAAAEDAELPEQSADPATGEGRPETGLPVNEFDHTHNPGHSHG